MSGYKYFVTDEQIREHQKRTPEEIFRWLEEMNILMSQLQTPEERRRAFDIKCKPAAHYPDIWENGWKEVKHDSE